MWVRAMYKYHTVALSVAPKRAALAQAQTQLDATLAELAAAQAKLQVRSDRVARALMRQWACALACLAMPAATEKTHLHTNHNRCRAYENGSAQTLGCLAFIC